VCFDDGVERAVAAGGVVARSGATPAFGRLRRHKASSSLLPSLWWSLPNGGRLEVVFSAARTPWPALPFAISMAAMLARCVVKLLSVSAKPRNAYTSSPRRLSLFSIDS
jgi:hypothetical protein